MPTMDEYRNTALEDRLERLARTPDEIASRIDGQSNAQLSRRPDDRSWSVKEIVCHLRDVEELFQLRFSTMLAIDEPKILVHGAAAGDLAPWRVGVGNDHPLHPDRWASERQYLRNDAHEAFAAFRRRRGEVVSLLRSLSAAEWQRGGIHLSRGRLTIGDWAASLAAHDDNHLDQLTRALDGRP